MTGIETALVLIGLFAFIAAVAYAAEGGAAWMIAAVIIAGIATLVPWRVR
ncbi:hypothetical protein [Methylobacterium iners]|uniref:Uncharacterized protein n=1 Tax=Methylobacterium iners TaxID=418707 RepID=A0ABQ4S8A9_9HYPH|nr:hypothetical protein [Methylobacterium iners]GJD98028.1 hypothetical protein OCOJLMKI_5267 [Methylobacterium iners]